MSPIPLGPIHPLPGATEYPENEKTEVLPRGPWNLFGRQSVGTTMPSENCTEWFGLQVCGTSRRLGAGTPGQEEPRGRLGEGRCWWKGIFHGEVRRCRNLQEGRLQAWGHLVTRHPPPTSYAQTTCMAPGTAGTGSHPPSLCHASPPVQIPLSSWNSFTTLQGGLLPEGHRPGEHLQPGLHMASPSLGWALCQDRPHLTLLILDSQCPT